MIVEREKILNSDIDPSNLERPTPAYLYGRMWNRELPDNVRLSLQGLRAHGHGAINRALESAVAERKPHVGSFCGLWSKRDEAMARARSHTQDFSAYSNNLWGCAVLSQVKAEPRFYKEPTFIARPRMAVRTAESVLRDLDSMLEEQDEPDFVHRPTHNAYDMTRGIIEASYAHYIGSAPNPTLASDGLGGIIVEWKSNGRAVRLIIPCNQEKKSYIYSRGTERSQIDYSVSGAILARQLRSIFSN